MDAPFWHERWQQNQIGFHQADINADLRRYWASLQLPPDSTVFVPLCGKSKDLLWLREQRHRVIGCELSQQAVEAFFTENQLQPVVTQQAHSRIFESPGIRIYCGDFFRLDATDLHAVSAVYDRAALIALPPAMRADYTRKMLALLPAAAITLLLTIDYPQHETAGPPFSVGEDEVRHWYETACTVEPLARRNTLQQEARFRERGVTRLEELVFLLRRREA